MISEIITAISKRLGAMYADCTVATDHVEQGLRCVPIRKHTRAETAERLRMQGRFPQASFDLGCQGDLTQQPYLSAFQNLCFLIRAHLKEPCFFIDLLEPSKTPLLGQRWRQENLFDVQLFDSEAGNARLYAVAEELFGSLEYITLPDGDLLRGTQMRFTVEDGVLHFFVTYAVILYRKENKECMEILELEEEVKEESDG